MVLHIWRTAGTQVKVPLANKFITALTYIVIKGYRKEKVRKNVVYHKIFLENS